MEMRLSPERLMKLYNRKCFYRKPGEGLENLSKQGRGALNPGWLPSTESNRGKTEMGVMVGHAQQVV